MSCRVVQCSAVQCGVVWCGVVGGGVVWGGVVYGVADQRTDTHSVFGSGGRNHQHTGCKRDRKLAEYRMSSYIQGQKY